MKPTLLIVDDEANTREGLKKVFDPKGYTVLLASSGKEALRVIEEQEIEVVVTDLRMPDIDGLELTKRIKEIVPSAVIIMLTAYGTIENAVEAMKVGAYDYLTKPVNLDKLEMLIERALSTRAMEIENRILKEQLDEKYGFENIIGSSNAMREIFETIRQVAHSKATVLIKGESGTGKEVIAHAIYNSGSRKDRPFVAVHCASLAESLFESELFGHEKGAFTGAVERKIGRFEMADKGTLFLDEVSEISLNTQVKLLRVIQEMEFERVGGSRSIKVDVRLIGATNADLDRLVGEQKFREDLYYRLSVITICMPPLRERKEDIPLLFKAFLDEFARENNKVISGVSPKLLQAFQGYSWPGNVRELKNCVESMVVLYKGGVLGIKDIPLPIREKIGIGGSHSVRLSTTLNVGEAEKKLIDEALARASGNKTQAAKFLGMSRRTLHRKIKEYGL